MKSRLCAALLLAALLFCLSACGFGSSAPPVYEVRFEMNGGTLVSGSLLQRVEEGAAAEAPVTEREGFEFTGWSESFDAVTANMVVVAGWSRLFDIRFETDGGALVSGEAAQRVAAGVIPEAPSVEKEYSDFAGWSPELAPAGSDTVYTALWQPRKLSSEEVFGKISPAVVEILVDEADDNYYGLGSGFFIDDSGTLVTNYHVIDGAVSGTVTLQDGSEHAILAVLNYDPGLDLAILKTDVSGNPYLTLSEKTVSTGETIYAMGSSEGLTSTFSAGIVSSASREIEGVRFIQITAPISEGNSGGPLVDLYGSVVGVNTMTYIEGQNLNFAIDIHELQRLDNAGEVTLAELFDRMYPDGVVAAVSDEGFYADMPDAEEEPNDIFLLSDLLENGEWLAGEVGGVDDMDWFYFEIDAPADVFLEIAPYYSEDNDYLLCGVLQLDETGDDVEALDVLLPTSDGSFEFSQSLSLHLDEAGAYFLLVFVDDDYPYDEPAFYGVCASW